MNHVRYRAKVEFGAAAVVIAIGAFFAGLAWNIDPDAYDSVGPRFVPGFVAGAMITLGALVAILAAARNSTLPAFSEEQHEPSDTEDFGFRDSDLSRVAWVVGAGAAYILLFHALGYFLATLLSLALILVTFGNRSVPTIAWLSVVGAVIYQYVFMGLMGLHDPPGWLIDASALGGLISGR